MAAVQPAKLNLPDSDDDDDGPLVFKRNPHSKQKMLDTAPKKPLQAKPISGPSSSKVQTSNSQRDKTITGVKSPVNSSLQRDKTIPGIKSSKLPVGNSQASSLVSGRPHVNHLSDRTSVGGVMQNAVMKPSGKSVIPDSDDSDDDKPLNYRKPLPVNVAPKLGVKNFKDAKNEADDDKPLSCKAPSKPSNIGSTEAKAKSDDSKDEKQSSHKSLQAPSRVGGSSVKSESDSFDDNRPLSFRTAAKPSNVVLAPAKAELDDYDSDDNKPLSFKTQSKSSSSGSAPVKSEMDSDDSDDNKPLSYRASVKTHNVVNALSKPGADDSDEDNKPLSIKFQQNGCLNGQVSPKPSSIVKKRPAEGMTNSAGPSMKKVKSATVSTTPSMSMKTESGLKKERKGSSDDDDDDYKPLSKGIKRPLIDTNKYVTKKTATKVVTSAKKVVKKLKKNIKGSKSQYGKSSKVPPGSGGGKKWTTLEHNGIIFPPQYKPHGVKMLYNGQPVVLTPEQEEVATMFAVMKDTEYATKKTFIENFMSDWKKILGKNHIIKKFELCDFTPIYDWYQTEKEKKKHMSAEEKKAQKEEKLKQEEKYMWAVVDGVKEKVGNFRVEPPGLFRGRGEHPKMGKLKRRIEPKDITINIGKGVPIPQCPIPGQRWKEVKHDNTVTWLAFWNDPINAKESKYVFLGASSSLKGQSDKEKYEKARTLKDYIDDIRKTYTKQFHAKTDVTQRQIAVATYLIDKLALRAGNEKDDDEADTVGCCTLKVENVTLCPPSSLEFDFLGKDSIRYKNTVEVLTEVYQAIGHFQKGKKGGDDLFDKLDTTKLNAHLKSLMPGLTAKVFRTYNASITLDEELDKKEKINSWKGISVAEKIAAYQLANKEVAIMCNHQRAVSKTHSTQMDKLYEKKTKLEEERNMLEEDLKRVLKGKPLSKDADGKTRKALPRETIEKKIAALNEKVEKAEMDIRTKEEMKNVALGTSKINYMDPRISVAWCKRNEVPIEKIFNKSLLAKFAWAMEVEPDYRF